MKALTKLGLSIKCKNHLGFQCLGFSEKVLFPYLFLQAIFLTLGAVLDKTQNYKVVPL